MKRKKTKKQKKLEYELLYLSFLLLGVILWFFIRDVKIVVMITAVVFILIMSLLISLNYQKKKSKESILRKSGILEIDQMDGIQFEYYLSALFKGLGYKVKVTKSTGDYGADLILSKDQEQIVVQAKRYAKNVGINAIQQITASKSYYNATKAWVVSNSFFTKSAVELAASNDVRLIDRKSLMDLIIKINPSGIPTAKEIRETVTPKAIHCPRCDSKMILRAGKNGQFYGCSKFPKCNGTKPY